MAGGFWSYVHADDAADGGRIARLARDVVEQFEMLTGEPIQLFLDRDALAWGHEWRERVDTNLATVAFFIPVLTPRYFLSPECRRELQTFARAATSLGVQELLLPLLYVDVPALTVDDPNDELIELVKRFQREDWRELRFEDVASGQYRRGVANLAQRLSDANRMAEAHAIAVPERPDEVAGEEEAPGALDQLARMEDALPELTDTVEKVSDEINSIGTMFGDALRQVRQADAEGRGMKARVLVARRLSRRLADPAERVRRLADKYASGLHDVDVGVRVITERAPKEIAENPDARIAFCEFFTAVRGMVAAAGEGVGALEEMTKAGLSLERLSRDLRPPVRTLRKGLTILMEGRTVTDGWLDAIEASDVDCPDEHTAPAGPQERPLPPGQADLNLPAEDPPRNRER